MEDRKAEGMIVVFGAGRQGECLISGLKKLGHDVYVADRLISEKVKELTRNSYSGLDFQDIDDINDVLDGWANTVDLVISCLPYFLNYKVAKTCIDRKIPYFDLGGHVETSTLINEYSAENNGLVFTDIGLAPGWVNIMAEDSYNSINKIDEVQAIQMFCGGLPLCKAGLENPPFCYGRTWSSEGLLNEYKDDCLVLKNGKVEIVPGMSGVEDHRGGWEAFYTSGGIGKTLDLMKDRGVKHCSYKTIRHKGHIEPVQSLISAGFGSDFFDKLFPVITKDYVMVEARANGKKSYYRNTQTIFSDDKFTAMQKCTAYPVASIVDLFIKNQTDNLVFGYSSCAALCLRQECNSLNYSNVPYKEFTEILSGLLGEDL